MMTTSNEHNNAPAVPRVEVCCQQFDTCRNQCVPLVDHLRGQIKELKAAPAVPDAAMVKRLQEEIERGCDGLALNEAYARAVLEYVLATPAPAPAVPQGDTVEIIGMKGGKEHYLGTMAMPPRMKAREIAREQFGHFVDDDGSDAELCFGALEQLIDYMQATPAAPSQEPVADRIDDEAQLQTAIAVMNDVLADIGDWEDQALADAVRNSKRDLEAMAQSICFMAAAPSQEPARPDLLERLNYHALERDDLTIDDCLDYLASGWKKVHGRTERQMVMQILALIAGQPSQERCHLCDCTGDIHDATGEWRGECPYCKPSQEPVTLTSKRKVIEIVSDHLTAIGADGLVCPDADCACRLGELAPCDGDYSNCQPGWISKPRDDQQDDWCMWTTKQRADEENAIIAAMREKESGK